MDKKLIIDPTKINQYVIRELKSRIWIIILPFLIIILGNIVMGNYYGLFKTLLYFLIFTAIVFYFIKEKAKTYYFVIKNNSIELNLDLQKANPIIGFGISFLLARNKSRYGKTENTLINFDDIDSIIIKPQEIVITSKNNNALINDAKIRIPIEIENFNSIKPIFDELKNTQK